MRIKSIKKLKRKDWLFFVAMLFVVPICVLLADAMRTNKSIEMPVIVKAGIVVFGILLILKIVFIDDSD